MLDLVTSFFWGKKEASQSSNETYSEYCISTLNSGNEIDQMLQKYDMEPHIEDEHKPVSSSIATEYRCGPIYSRGTYGCVFLTTSRHSDEIYATKIINAEKLTTWQAARIAREKLALQVATNSPLVLKHQNFLPQLVASFEKPPITYFVLKLVKGYTLENHISYAKGDILYNALDPLQGLEPRKTKLENLAQFLGELCMAILELHKFVKVGHRDIKPANIIIDCLGKPTLCDFGFVSDIGGKVDLNINQDAPLCGITSDSIGIGSPIYSAPEVLLPSGFSSSQMYDVESADAWPLGIVIYEILFDQTPFQRECEQEHTVHQQLARLKDNLRYHKLGKYEIRIPAEDTIVPPELLSQLLPPWKDLILGLIEFHPLKRCSITLALDKLRKMGFVETKMDEANPYFASFVGSLRKPINLTQTLTWPDPDNQQSLMILKGPQF